MADGESEERLRAGPQDWERIIDDPDAPLFTLGVVAELVGVDPQVLRNYDKRGLIEPRRSDSGHRRFSRRDIQRVARALSLSQEGIPPQGIQRILELEDRVAELERSRDPEL